MLTMSHFVNNIIFITACLLRLNIHLIILFENLCIDDSNDYHHETYSLSRYKADFFYNLTNI